MTVSRVEIKVPCVASLKLGTSSEPLAQATQRLPSGCRHTAEPKKRSLQGGKSIGLALPRTKHLIASEHLSKLWGGAVIAPLSESHHHDLRAHAAAAVPGITMPARLVAATGGATAQESTEHSMWTSDMHSI